MAVSRSDGGVGKVVRKEIARRMLRGEMIDYDQSPRDDELGRFSWVDVGHVTNASCLGRPNAIDNINWLRKWVATVMCVAVGMSPPSSPGGGESQKKDR